MAPRPRAPQTPEEALGRALAKTLRHKAQAQGIPQDQQGWCLVSDLLCKSPYTNLKADREQIEDVVRNDKKGRYEFNSDKSKIRAVQGHSVELDVGLQPLVSENEFPEIVVHGTYKDAWAIIKTAGLSKMKRQHIHFAQQLPKKSPAGEQQKTVISGIRSSAQVYIFIDIPKALEAGVPFFKSTNGVILSPGLDGTISPTLFLKVTDSQMNPID